MKANIGICFIILLIITVSCNHEVEDPKFYGITRTNENGNVLSVDTEDWKPDAVLINGKLDSNYIIYPEPAYPNPFNSSITFQFTFTMEAYYHLTIFDKPGHIFKQFEKMEARRGKYCYMITSDSIFTTNGIYRVIISARATNSTKTCEIFGDIEHKTRL
jgi:hypothetical protein